VAGTARSRARAVAGDHPGRAHGLAQGKIEELRHVCPGCKRIAVIRISAWGSKVEHRRRGRFCVVGWELQSGCDEVQRKAADAASRQSAARRHPGPAPAVAPPGMAHRRAVETGQHPVAVDSGEARVQARANAGRRSIMALSGKVPERAEGSRSASSSCSNHRGPPARRGRRSRKRRVVGQMLGLARFAER